MVAAIVAMTVAIVVVLSLALATETGVTVTEIRWFGSNSCGGLSDSTTAGFRGAEGGQERYTVTGLVNHNATARCTIHSVSSMDPGFTVIGGSYPLTIPAEGSANLTVTLALPDAAFDASLSMLIE
jgi:hypothetical protein